MEFWCEIIVALASVLVVPLRAAVRVLPACHICPACYSHSGDQIEGPAVARLQRQVRCGVRTVLSDKSSTFVGPRPGLAMPDE